MNNSFFVFATIATALVVLAYFAHSLSSQFQ